MLRGPASAGGSVEAAAGGAAARGRMTLAVEFAAPSTWMAFVATGRSITPRADEALWQAAERGGPPPWWWPGSRRLEISLRRTVIGEVTVGGRLVPPSLPRPRAA